MRPVEIVAYTPTLTERRHVRAESLESLRRSDWGAEAVAVIDQVRFPGQPKARSIDNARETLERAAQSDHGDLILFFEDDLEFNRHLRHNLENWSPLVGFDPSDHFCGSLYNPDVGSLDPALDTPTCRVADPELTYGCQAVLLSRPTLNWILERWRAQRGLGDLRIFRLAAMKTPILYHRPSLVQHRSVPSGWGGVAHSAVDYSADFRAHEVR